MMSEVKTIQMFREVGFLIEPEVSHVSIVDRGANQTPFKVVKNHKGGEKMTKVVYSIVAPKNVTQEDIKKALGEELVNIVKFDTSTENGEVVRYVQQPIESFKEETLSLVEIDKELGIKALCAEPKEEDAGLIGKLFKKKSEVIMTEEAEIPLEQVVKSMSWEVDDEMYAMVQAVRGILSQTNGDVSKKLKQVKEIWGNFYTFLSDSITVSKGEALVLKELEYKANQGVETNEEDAETVIKKDTEVDKETKVEEPVEVEKKEEAPAVEVEAAPSMEDVVKAEVEKATAPLVEAVKALTEKLAGATEEIKKMEQLVPSAPASTEVDPVEVKKTERDPKDFTGSIFGRK